MANPERVQAASWITAWIRTEDRAQNGSQIDHRSPTKPLTTTECQRPAIPLVPV